jgi:hypothetical protein
MEETIPEQAEKHEILISGCAEPARNNTSGFSNINANICRDFMDLHEQSYKY